jgi:hypothetical protein
MVMAQKKRHCDLRGDECTALDQPSQGYQRSHQTQNCQCDKYHRVGWHVCQKIDHLALPTAMGQRQKKNTAIASMFQQDRENGDAAISALMSTRPSVMGPVMSSLPRVIVASPSSRFCPWSTLRPPHCAVRGSGEPI